MSSFPDVSRAGSPLPRPVQNGSEPSQWNYWRSESDHADNLVVLHGLGGDHEGSREIISGVRGVNIIAPDLPGYGASAPLPVPHTLENYAAALEKFRTDLGLEEFHLVGHSLGASIALVYAGRYGADLKSLCLLNPVSVADGFTATLGKLYYRIGAALPHWLGREWLAGRPAIYLSNSLIIKTRDAARRRWILEQDYRNYRRASIPAMVESFLSYYETPFAEHAARVTARTLLVTGDKDGIAPPDSVTRLHNTMRSSRLEIVPGAGHLLPVEDSAGIGAVLTDFLNV
jgi:pimeloyl-ACP methyl ester carboxylesterase